MKWNLRYRNIPENKEREVLHTQERYICKFFIKKCKFMIKKNEEIMKNSLKILRNYKRSNLKKRAIGMHHYGYIFKP